MLAYLVKQLRLGTNRNTPRLWLEGKYLSQAGFTAGRHYSAEANGPKIKLTVCENGARIVSYKQKGDDRLPIIDLNSKELLDIFTGYQSLRITFKEGRIYILPLASEVRRKERMERLMERITKKMALAVGSLCHGGGVLSRAIHEGLASEGLPSRCGFAVELREELLSQSRDKNPFWDDRSQYLSSPLQELAYDEWAMSQMGKVDILEMALPCSGASTAGRSKNKIAIPEEHPDVGHLVAAATAIIAKVNPSVIICENVTEYGKSASAAILRNQLRDMGYKTQERIMNGLEFNELEDRTRWCLVAFTDGMDCSFEDLPIPRLRQRKLAEVLEDIPADHPSWSAYQYLKDKQEKDLSQGKGFRLQTFTPEDGRIATITKGYAKIRSTDPKIAHPSDPELMRQLTVKEHARSKGIPENMTEGLCQTTAHEMLGQSVCFGPFVAVGRMIAGAIKSFAENSAAALEPRGTGFGCAA